jgi:hypothetical protein
LPASEQPQLSEFVTPEEVVPTFGSRFGRRLRSSESRAEKVGAGTAPTELEQRPRLFNGREAHRIGERKVVWRDASTASRLKQQRGLPAERRGGWGILSQKSCP